MESRIFHFLRLRRKKEKKEQFALLLKGVLYLTKMINTYRISSEIMINGL